MKVTDGLAGAKALAVTHETIPWESLSHSTKIYYRQQAGVVLEAALAAAKPNTPNEKLDEIDELANLIRQIVSVEMKADAEMWPMTIAAHALVITDHTAELRAAAPGTLPEEAIESLEREARIAKKNIDRIVRWLNGLRAYAAERQKGEAE